MYQTGSKNLKLCLERVSLIDFHLIKYWWSEKWKFLFFFSWKSNRERERERETCNWTMRRRRGLVVGDEIVDYCASTRRRREMSSDHRIFWDELRFWGLCERVFVLTLFQGLKILGDIFYQGLWQSCLEKCLNSEGKIHTGE